MFRDGLKRDLRGPFENLFRIDFSAFVPQKRDGLSRPFRDGLKRPFFWAKRDWHVPVLEFAGRRQRDPNRN